MTGRSVIWIQRAFGGGRPRILLEEPNDHPDASAGLDLDYTADQPLFDQMKTGPWNPDLVERVGSKLYGLLTGHPAIAADFKTRLDPGASNGPIYLRVESAEIEELPWEALVDPRDGFIALDARWPVARMKKVASAKPEYLFLPPLKILAVLGASGPDELSRLSAKSEWEELLAGIRDSALNIRLRVLVCEDELKESIEALKLDWIEVEFLQDDTKLFREISQFRPQILHFFCHGIAETPPFLQVASRLNWKRKEEGTINIEGSQLRQRADRDENVWLITLNCCESAQQAAGGGSRSRPLASSLVSQGFPAVVGMRERVDSVHANRFCGLWYTHILETFEKRLTEAAAGQTPAEFHWAVALFAARQGICSAVENGPLTLSARRNKEWTIPVLYTRYQPFTIRLAPDPQGEHPLRRLAPAATGAPTAPPLVAHPEPAPVAPPPAATAPATPPAPAPVAPVPVTEGLGPTIPSVGAVAPPTPSHGETSANNGGGIGLSEKLSLVAEMQELLSARDKLSMQANLPDSIRASVVAEITGRLSQIEKKLSGQG